MMPVFRAMLLDAYRELNSKRLFWVILGISGIVVVFYGSIGFSDTGMSMFFGLLDIENEMLTRESMLSKILYRSIFSTFILGIWLAWIATILALISTASIFPDFISGGSIDLVLSKPIGRVRLFFYKYLASLLFVVLQVALFCVGVFLCLGLRLDDWEWRIFLAIPLLAVFFSYLYSVCVLVGVWTKSTLTALLLTMLCWFSAYSVNTAEAILNMIKMEAVVQIERADEDAAQRAEEQGTDPESIDTTDVDSQRELVSKLDPWHTFARTCQAILPKTGETIGLLDRWLRRDTDINIMDILSGSVSQDDQGGFNRSAAESNDQEVQRRLQEQIESRSEFYVIGSSLLFEAIVLGLACFVFVRRDY